MLLPFYSWSNYFKHPNDFNAHYQYRRQFYQNTINYKPIDLN